MKLGKHKYIIEDSQGNSIEYPPNPSLQQYTDMIERLTTVVGAKLHVYKYSGTYKHSFNLEDNDNE